MNSKPDSKEQAYPFTYETYWFVGRKATAIYFGEERVPVKTWTQVYEVIMNRCNQQRHDALMYLRDKVAGKCRVFLSASPENMVRPLKIDEDLYGETHYGSATLIHILRDRILFPARFDYSDIRIALQ